jgi:hypothetical protein
MPIEFPVPTFIGETFFAGGKGWRWNGFAWDSIANTAAIGATGPIGATGLTGQSSTFYNYKADTTITSGTPAINTLYWNNATQISSAVVTLSHIDALGNDLDVFFPLFKTNDTFVIQDQSNSNNFQTWKISATPTVVLNSYISIPVTLVTSGGTSQFTNNQQLIFAIVTSGLQGSTGATGLVGPFGATGLVGSTGSTGAGTTGATGVGYDGVTSTSFAVPASSGEVVTLIPNKQGAFISGSRVRAINTSSNYFEGTLAIPFGGAFQITQDFNVGTTPASSWTITLAGVRGQQGSTGATGLVGATGLQGNVGSTGATGSAAVVTPGTTNNAIVRASGTGNNAIKGSGLIISDLPTSFAITGLASTNTITAVGHTFTQYTPISLADIVGGDGLLTSTTYFVFNISGNTFQLSLRSGGLASAVDFSTNITSGFAVSLQNNFAIVPSGSFSDISLVLSPKGNGAIISNIPSSTVDGGYARGKKSVDLQLLRTSPSNVASGDYSGLFAGAWNTVQSSASVILSGQNNRIVKTTSSFPTFFVDSYYSAIVSGANNLISDNGYSIICGGTTNEIKKTDEFTPTLQYNAIIAGNLVNLNNSSNTIAFGNNHISNYADNCFISGRYGEVSNSNSEIRAYQYFPAINTQLQRVSLFASTTNATPTTLLNYNVTANQTFPFYIPSNKIYGFHIKVVGVQTGGANASFFSRQGMIKNVSGTTSLVGAISTIGTDIETNVATNLTITADDTNDALKVDVTGIAAQTWNWMAEINIIDMGF